MTVQLIAQSYLPRDRNDNINYSHSVQAPFLTWTVY